MSCCCRDQSGNSLEDYNFTPSRILTWEEIARQIQMRAAQDMQDKINAENMEKQLERILTESQP